ncbi:hypothetical protein [Raoultella ornithinolytica]|uniref:hypothetical protein n=1 Tax=Raoultella ornithinolytica TaxID=54291 RepID=UPI00384A97F0
MRQHAEQTRLQRTVILKGCTGTGSRITLGLHVREERIQLSQGGRTYEAYVVVRLHLLLQVLARAYNGVLYVRSFSCDD